MARKATKYNVGYRKKHMGYQVEPWNSEMMGLNEDNTEVKGIK